MSEQVIISWLQSEGLVVRGPFCWASARSWAAMAYSRLLVSTGGSFSLLPGTRCLLRAFHTALV